MSDEQKNDVPGAQPESQDSQPTDDSSAEQAPESLETQNIPPNEEQPPKGLGAKLLGMDELKPGMTVRLHERIKDVSPKGEERERIQVFEGIILGIRGAGISRTLRIRKVTGGYGVEKIFPLQSPIIVKVELVKTAKVRKAKLSYLTNVKKRFRRKLKETWANR